MSDMHKKYISDRINFIVEAIIYEEGLCKKAKELGHQNSYTVTYATGILDTLRQELYSHEHFLRSIEIPND